MVPMVPVIPVVPTIPMVAFDSDSKRFFLKDFDYCVSVGHGQERGKKKPTDLVLGERCCRTTAAVQF